MRSWNPLRLDRPSERDLKRRKAADLDLQKGKEKETQKAKGDSEDDGVEEPPARARDDSITTSPRRARRMRDSVVSLSAVGDSPIHVNRPALPVPQIPEALDSPVYSRPQRFSMLKFRHASDSQISKTAKEHSDAANIPPMPIAPPSIITTAPTMDNFDSQRRKSAFLLPRKQKMVPKKKSQVSLHSSRNDEPRPTPTPSPSQRVTFDESNKLRGTPPVPHAPPPYGDESSSALALPISRMSESSRSDGSSGEHGVFATTTTTHTVSTTTTFFRLSRKKKDKGPLFPLPPKVNASNLSATNTPRLSQARDSESPNRPVFHLPSESSSAHGTPRRSGQQSPTRITPRPGANALRSGSRTSFHSQSSSAFGRPSISEQRGRSSTMSSLRRALEDEQLPAPPVPHSTRTSTSTSGRPSFGGLFNMTRFKHGSESALHRNLGTNGPGTPGSFDSKQNSFNLPREPPIVIPERQEGDTPAKYLARLEEVVNRGALVTLLSKSNDEFTKNVMRSFMRRFKFFEDPLDMAVRKLLMHVELPKETQQIDRTLQSFADRYHECNPGIFASTDDAYFVAFSILILHTDFFNKNNKHKMQKTDYIKNTRSSGGVATEILDCFYDNTSYTPFIHVEDDVEVTAERIIAQKSSKKSGLKPSGSSSHGKGHKGPVDPYTLILDSQLDSLRPPLDEILNLEDCFNYLATGGSINISELNRTFFKSGVLQIVSARSRPEAFANQATISNPSEAQVGVVDMKITKVGCIWRKDQKKKKARSPWQEWGAILTGSQLYFFRNTSWVKNLMHQYDHHVRAGRAHNPIVFKPPIEQLKPDFLVSMEDAVALVDSKYKKHKHAFIFTRQNIYSEVFLADTDAEMRDWISKLNYAATFRTAGVRMRGVLPSSSQENRKTTESQRSGSVASADSAKPTIQRNRTEDELARQIMVARRQIMGQKIREADEKITTGEQQLEGLLRTARHISVLTPIQPKTREEVVVAAVRLANSIRWAQIGKWRIQCHRDILALDLEEDLKLHVGESIDKEKEKEKDDIAPQTTKDSNQGRLGFGRLGGKNNATTGHSNSKHRPGSQPTGSKMFSMDEIFRTPSRLKPSHYRPRGSWEIPPLNFDRRQSQSTNRNSRAMESRQAEAKVSEEGAAIDTEQSEDDASAAEAAERHSNPGEASKPSIYRATSETIAAESIVAPEKDEHELLVKAGALAPSPKSTITSKAKDRAAKDSNKASTDGGTTADESEHDNDTLRATDVSDKEALSKVRHSFQRKLQSSQVLPHHHHRSSSKRSGRPVSGASTLGNASSNATGVGGHASGTDDADNSTTGSLANSNNDKGPAETGLTRASGSFTVHGKKASIITFGDEWANMTPEERVKLHQRLPKDRDTSAETMMGASRIDESGGSGDETTEGQREQTGDGADAGTGLGLSGFNITGAPHHSPSAPPPPPPIAFTNVSGGVGGAAGGVVAGLIAATNKALKAARGEADHEAAVEAQKVRGHGTLSTRKLRDDDGDEEATDTEEGANGDEDGEGDGEDEDEDEDEDGEEEGEEGYKTAEEEGAISPTTVTPLTASVPFVSDGGIKR